MDYDTYIDHETKDENTTFANAERATLNVVGEFAQSAWHSGVTEKVNGVTQLCGGKLAPEEKAPERKGAVMLAHVAGSTVGEITDFIVASKVVGKGINGLAAKTVGLAQSESFIAKSALGRNAVVTASLLQESELAREVATAGTTGLLFGSVLRPVKEGESQFQRVGNGITEAATFATLSGVAGKYKNAFTDDLAGRIKLNAISGAAAGVVNTNMDALMHGRVASVESNLMNAAGWAVGNVVTAEAMHGIARNWESGKALVSEAKAELAERGKREPALINMLSMRDMIHGGDTVRANRNIDAYYPEFERAFPLEGEIEPKTTYTNDYLADREGTWDMEILTGPTIGGLQYQILDVGATSFDKAGWLEHIWVKDAERGKGYGIGLFNYLKARVKAKEGDFTFWEWNNPDKMTAQELADDARGGISTQDRESWWGDAGALVAVDSKGRIAPYAQPSMGVDSAGSTLPEVAYLSLAFTAPEPMAGRKIPVEDYLNLCHTAHRTFLGDNWQSDPTLKTYTDAVRALGEQEFTLVSLSEIARLRAAQLGRATWRPDGY